MRLKGSIVVIVSFILGIVLFAYILGDINLGKTISLLDNAKPVYILGYIAASIAIMVLFASRWWIILKSQGIQLSLVESFFYRVADYTISFLTPGPQMGGEFARAGLLENHGIEYSKAFSSAIIDKSIELLGNAIMILSGVVYVTTVLSMPFALKISFYSISLVFLVVIGAFVFSMAKRKSLFHRLFKILRLDRVKSLKKRESSILKFEKYIMEFYATERKHFWFSLSFSVLIWTVYIIEFKYLLLMMGFDLGIAKLFLVNVTLGIAYLVPVPMALGALELSLISIMTILSLPASAGVLLALIKRARDLLWAPLGLWALVYYGFGIKKALRKAFKNF